MNFLELVDDLRIQCGASGRAPATLQGALPTETDRFRRWVNSAWNDIQISHTDWRFLFIESSHTMAVNSRVLNQTEYAAGNVAEWMVDTFRIADPAKPRMDSQPLPFVPYYEWRDNEGRDTTITGKPSTFTIDPMTEAILLAPTSDKAYVLFYDYWKNPQVLVANNDVPIIPKRFHDLIVAWAMKKYGYHEAASEKLQQANEVISRLYPALEMDQLPAMNVGTLWN